MADNKIFGLFAILAVVFFIFFKWCSTRNVSYSSCLVTALVVSFLICGFVGPWKSIFVENHDDEFV